MQAKVERLGDGLALRIPAELAAGLVAGTPVEVRVDAGKLVVDGVPVTLYPIEWLTEGMTPDDYHKEVDWGEPAGGEVW